MLFYFPHWLWKTLEDRKLDKITNGLRGKIRKQMLKNGNLQHSLSLRRNSLQILRKFNEGAGKKEGAKIIESSSFQRLSRTYSEVIFGKDN